MGDSPDYTGAWGVSHFHQLPTWQKAITSGPYFHLFIDKRDGQRFTGRIEDVFGNSNVEGTITDNSIQFTKTYDKDAIEKGGSNQPLTYSGIRRTAGQREFFAGVIDPWPQPQNQPVVFIIGTHGVNYLNPSSPDMPN